MTQEEKELLLKDLCARLPYGVVLDVDTTDWKAPQGHIQVKIEGVGLIFKDQSLIVNGSYYGDNYKPYLRPMSSMTEEEFYEYNYIRWSKIKDKINYERVNAGKFLNVGIIPIADYLDWLLKNHFDFMGLIPKGLAIEVTEDNNPYKE